MGKRSDSQGTTGQLRIKTERMTVARDCCGMGWGTGRLRGPLASVAARSAGRRCSLVRRRNGRQWRAAAVCARTSQWYRPEAMTTTTDIVSRVDVEQAELAAKLFRSLGDPTRLRLVLCLLHGEHRVVDLVAEVGLAQSTVSSHLACLRDCGLLDMRPVGRQSYYRLAHDVRELLTATEALLSRIGYDVSLCSATPAPPASLSRS